MGRATFYRLRSPRYLSGALEVDKTGSRAEPEGQWGYVICPKLENEWVKLL